MALQNARRRCAAIWPLAAMLLTACATPPAPSATSCPLIPSPPPLTQPLPQPSYSLSAAEAIRMWQKRLTGTLATR